MWRSTDCLKLLVDWRRATTERWKDTACCWKERGAHGGSNPHRDQDGLKKEIQKDRHPRSEESEESVSNDESGGCKLEQMTMKKDNELSLGAWADDMERKTLVHGRWRWSPLQRQFRVWRER